LPRIKESGIIEASPYSVKMNELRLLLLRDEIDKVIERVESSREDLRCMAMLLEDPGAGVPVLAADALKIAALRGCDIGYCEEELEKALYDKYAKRNAAGALAVHYRSKGLEEKVDELVASPDTEIAEGARDALKEMRKHA
jgi:hypothetical protein